MLSCYDNLWPGASPGPPLDIRATQGGRPTWSVPGMAKAEGVDGAAHQIRQRQARAARLGVPRGAPASLARTFARTGVRRS